MKTSRLIPFVSAVFLLIAMLLPQPASGQYDAEWKHCADSITAGCKTPYQKAKAIYMWEIFNIQYDYSYRICFAEDCWKFRKGICHAISVLYVELAHRCGLDAWVIIGDAKTSEYPDGDGFHAWVGVKTEKGIILIDPTWGACTSSRFSSQEELLNWFDVKPAHMIFTHFPYNDEYQRLSTPLTKEQYKSLPIISPIKLKKEGKASAVLAYYLEHPVKRNTPEEPQPIVQSGNDLILNLEGVSYKLVQVDSGTVTLGEKCVHNETVANYYMGETEVTQALWKAVMGTTVQQQWEKSSQLSRSMIEGDDYPMFYVNYYEVDTFINKLNQLTGRTFRLPTNTEWEYAARGGNKSCGYRYSGSNNLDSVAWYKDNSDEKIHPVKTKQPNELGLFDMSGNVEEWVGDWYSGTQCQCRGGWYSGSEEKSDVTVCYALDPSHRFSILGFRLVLEP